MDFIRIIIAILLPPLGVFLQVGFAGAFWLNTVSYTHLTLPTIYSV